MHPRLLQPKLLLRALVPVHLLLLDRRPDEAAVRTKRPAMINAAMRLRIARLAKTHLHPAMRTHVQRYLNHALTITRHKDRQSVAVGKRMSVRVERGGRGSHKTKKNK